MRLGVVTDTQDRCGRVLERRAIRAEHIGRFPDIARGFLGEILQVPPMYSALKRGGRPLYQLARRGVTVEREPRPVEIYWLELISWEPPCLTLDVECSSGTYVRSIAHDLGQALGCGAHLAGLVRRAIGDFRLEDAAPVDRLTRAQLRSLLHPLDSALRSYPAMHLEEAAARAVRSGRAVVAPESSDGAALARAYGPDGTFLAVLEYQPRGGVWHPRKVIHPL